MAFDKKTFNLWRTPPYLLFFIIAGIIAIIVIIHGWKETGFYKKLQLSGTVTTGKVIRKEIEPDSRGGRNLFFIYVYQDKKGVEYTAQTSLYTFTVGQSLDLTYLADKPASHVLFHLTDRRVWQPLEDSILFALGVLLVPAGFGMLAIYLDNRLKNPNSGKR